MEFIESKQKKMFDLKKCTRPFKDIVGSTQDAIEILKVSERGVFKISKNEYSKTYLIEDVNYDTRSHEEREAFYDAWCDVIDSFSVRFKISTCNLKMSMKMVHDKILYRMKQDDYDAVREAYNSIISNKIIKERKGLEKKKYLTVIKECNSYEEAKRYFSNAENNFIENFGKIGAKLIPLTGSERLYPIFGIYRVGDEDTAIPDIGRYIRSGQDWKNEAASDSIRFESDRVLINDRPARTMFIDPRSYGSTFDDKLYDELGSLDAVSVCSIDYIPIPKAYVQATLENKNMMTDDRIARQRKRHNNDRQFLADISYVLRKEKEEIEGLLEEARQGDTRMLWVSVGVTFIADTEEELAKCTERVMQICDNNGCIAKTVKGQQREAMNTVLPIGVRNVEWMRAMFTRMAAGFIPFRVMEAVNYDSPFYYGTNSESGNPILFNRKNLINANGFVIGKPGSGKSMTGEKMELGSVFINTDDDIIIIDPQNEMKGVVAMFGGTYIDLDTKTDTYVNPLHVDMDVFESSKKMEETVKEKNQLMYSIVENSIDNEEMFGISTIMERAVKMLYLDIYDLSPEDRYVPVMSDLYHYIEKQEVLERDAGNRIKAEAAEKLAICMERFIDGTLDIYNHQTNVDTDNRVVAYGMLNLGKELWSVSIAIMLLNIKERVIANFKKGRATWIYIDEFHYLTKKPHSRLFVKEMYQTFRKFGGICTGILQNVSELTAYTDTATMLSNSEYTMIMGQSETDAGELLKVMAGKITREQLKYVKHDKPGIGLIRFGDVVVPMNNVMDKSNPLYKIFNTNMHEKAKEKRGEC